MSKWLGRLTLGLLFALVILWVVPRVSGFAPAPAPAASEPSVADKALKEPPMAQPPVSYEASSPASVADVVLMNPNVPAQPPVTSASPLPPIPDFRPVIQQPPVIPRIDPTATDVGIQTVMKQKVTLPQPPAIIATPNMTQGLEAVSMSSVTGMDV
jgi:hypothetical protein